MPRSSFQKLKIIYIMEYLLKNSDEDHAVTTSQIIAYLKSHDITAERKTIYSDIDALRDFGLDIIQVSEGNNHGYYVARRDFELPELKLLVDSVQSSKFITHKKTLSLIKKIEKLASIHSAQLLIRQVFVKNRIKTMNESIYYNVDRIHSAIADNFQITFQYFQWNVDKKMELRHNGIWYKVSPWSLSWDDENYYLIAYDSVEHIIKHFRVDKMLHIKSIKKFREGKKSFNNFDMAAYARKMFGMYGGKEEYVHIKCDNSLAGVMIDRFGKDVSMVRLDEEHFVTNVEVSVSRQFLAWVIGLGEGVTILGPQSVVDMMKEEIKRLTNQYE